MLFLSQIISNLFLILHRSGIIQRRLLHEERLKEQQINDPLLQDPNMYKYGDNSQFPLKEYGLRWGRWTLMVNIMLALTVLIVTIVLWNLGLSIGSLTEKSQIKITDLDLNINKLKN